MNQSSSFGRRPKSILIFAFDGKKQMDPGLRREDEQRHPSKQ
jgi:hypothetical protein